MNDRLYTEKEILEQEYIQIHPRIFHKKPNLFFVRCSRCGCFSQISMVMKNKKLETKCAWQVCGANLEFNFQNDFIKTTKQITSEKGIILR